MPSPLVWRVVLPGLLLAVSCGGSREATEKQLAQMRAEVVKVRVENGTLADRIERLERLAREARTRELSAVTHPSLDERPELAVVRLSPETADETAVADDLDEADRPVLRSVGRGVIEDRSRQPSSGAQTATSARKR